MSFDPAVTILKLQRTREHNVFWTSLSFFSVDMDGFLSLVSVKLAFYCDPDFYIYFCGHTNIFTKPEKFFPDTVKCEHPHGYF